MSLNGQESNESKVDVTEVDKITKEIQNLVETPDQNTETQKDLNEKLTNDVVDQLISSTAEVKKELKESIMKLFERYENDQTFLDSNKWFVKLAEALWLKQDEDWSWIDAQDVVEDAVDDIKEPSISWNWELWGIKAGEESEKQSGNKGLYKGLTREKIDGVDSSDKNLYDTINKIWDQINALYLFL